MLLGRENDTIWQSTNSKRLGMIHRIAPWQENMRNIVFPYQISDLAVLPIPYTAEHLVLHACSTVEINIRIRKELAHAKDLPTRRSDEHYSCIQGRREKAVLLCCVLANPLHSRRNVQILEDL
jgi:hypothetical protein